LPTKQIIDVTVGLLKREKKKIEKPFLMKETKLPLAPMREETT
jgi:hypothetical protein